MELNKERTEYITTIFKLTESKKAVTNKILSEVLGVAPSSVTEMLRKLKNDDFLTTTNPILLSKKGISFAKDVISKHRLWEYFLTKTLNYNWEDVHEQAQLLQNITSDKLFDKLNNFLGYPEFCPHGGQIYKNNEGIKEKLSLASGKVGNVYIIESIYDEKLLLSYIKNLNLNIGDKIKIISYDDFDQTCKVKKENGETINISPKALKDIFIK